MPSPTSPRAGAPTSALGWAARITSSGHFWCVAALSASNRVPPPACAPCPLHARLMPLRPDCAGCCGSLPARSGPMQSSHFARPTPPSQDSPAVALRRRRRAPDFDSWPAGGVGLPGAAQGAAVFRLPWELRTSPAGDFGVPGHPRSSARVMPSLARSAAARAPSAHRLRWFRPLGRGPSGEPRMRAYANFGTCMDPFEYWYA